MLPTSPVAPIISATTGSPSASTVTLAGVVGTLYDFSGAGSITCATPGRARVLVIGGASADNGANYGNAGSVFAGWIDFTAGTHVVVVGAAVSGNTNGGHSRIGSLAGALGAVRPFQAEAYGGAGLWISGATTGAGVPDDITGASVTYGKTYPLTNTATEYGSSYPGQVRAGRVFIFVPN